MIAISLLPESEVLAPSEVEQWVEAALAEANVLRQYDNRLFPLVDDPVLFKTANAIREAWKQWLDDTRSLLRRISPVGPVPRLNELEKHLWHARGCAAFSPEETFRRYQKVEAGEKLLTLEEVRRELGLPPRR